MPCSVPEEERTRRDTAESQGAEVSKSRESPGPVCKEATRPVQQLRSRSTGALCKSVSIDVDAVRGCAAKCLQKPQAVGDAGRFPFDFAHPQGSSRSKDSSWSAWISFAPTLPVHRQRQPC
mmetsp:Transcript_11620/g.27823  ORF Transcript_11620/g.27823 Transcript_11620/m.27823 type:complete len:121 (-) Transcript_11620:135-497(-)